MPCGLNRFELRLIYKIAYKNRWCKKHISKEDLIKGTDKSERDKYKEAITNLLRDGWLMRYPSQGREDVCLPKKSRTRVLEALKSHQREYSFIKHLQFIR